MRQLTSEGDKAGLKVLHLSHSMVTRLASQIVNDTATFSPWALKQFTTEGNPLITKSKTGSLSCGEQPFSRRCTLVFNSTCPSLELTCFCVRRMSQNDKLLELSFPDSGESG